MDQVSRIKELVRLSLDTSFGGGISINEMVVLPTQKFSDEVNEWVPDSYTIFLSVKDKRPDQPDFYYFSSDDPRYKLQDFLESLLGFECCVDFV